MSESRHTDPYWANIPSHFDSKIKQSCLEDLKAYYAFVHDRLNSLPLGDPQRLSLMAEINGILGAIKSLTKASEEEVQQSHALFLENAAKTGFTPPSS
jgi:hypothetical protein